MEFPLTPFNIYDYLKFDNYDQVIIQPTGKSEIFCYGTCDLWSIRPINQSVFYWAEYFKESDYKGTIFPVDQQWVNIKSYLDSHTPKYFCYTLGITGKFVNLGPKIFGITKNSGKTIRYLKRKSLIDSAKESEMYSLVDTLNSLTREEIIAYYTNHLDVLIKYCNEKNIKFYWTFNSTITANEFFNEYENDIITNILDSKTYVGWVSNLDSQPEKSMGSLTQYQMYKKFHDAING